MADVEILTTPPTDTRDGSVTGSITGGTLGSTGLAGSVGGTLATNAAGTAIPAYGWLQGEIGLPKSTVIADALANYVSPALEVTDSALAFAEKAAQLVETLAPLYGDAATVGKKAVIQTIRNLLNGWKLDFHLLCADVPYGKLYSGGETDVEAVKKARARLKSSFTDAWPWDSPPEQLMPMPAGGAPALLTLLKESLRDVKDLRRPMMDSGSTVAGLSFVAGTSALDDAARFVSTIKRVAKLFYAIGGGSNDSRDLFWHPQLRIVNLRAERVSGGVYLTWNDGVEEGLGGYPANLNTAAGQVRLTKPPTQFRVLTKAAISAATPGAGDSTTDWTVLHYGDVESRPLTGEYTYLIPESNLPPQPAGQLPIPYQFIVQFTYEDGTVEAPAGTPVSGYSGPWAQTYYVPTAPPPAGSVGTPPNWLKLGTSDYFNGSLERGVIQTTVQAIEKVLDGLDNNAQDTAKALEDSAAWTRRKIERVRTDLRAVAELAALLNALAELRASGYIRAFQRGFSPTDGLFGALTIADGAPPKPTGLDLLMQEYDETFKVLPFQRNTDLVFGAFVVVVLPPAGSPTFAPMKAAWNFFLSLFGLTENGFNDVRAQWDNATWDKLGGKIVEITPGQTTATAQATATAALTVDAHTAAAAEQALGYTPPPPPVWRGLGETERLSPQLDLNCPPAPNTDVVFFRDDMTPITG